MRVITKKEDQKNWTSIKSQLIQTQKIITQIQSSIKQNQKINIENNSSRQLPPLIKVRKRIKIFPNSRKDLIISQRQEKNILQNIKKKYSSLQPIDLAANISKKKKYYSSFNNMILIKNKFKLLSKSKPTSSRVHEYCMRDRSLEDILLNRNKKSFIHSSRKRQNIYRYTKSQQKLNIQHLNQNSGQAQLQLTNRSNKKLQIITQFDYILDLIKKKKINQFNCKQLKIRNKQINNIRSSFLARQINLINSTEQKVSIPQVVSPTVRIISHQNLLNKQKDVELQRLRNKKNSYFKGLNFKKNQKKKSISSQEIQPQLIRNAKKPLQKKQFCPWEQNGNSFYFTKFQNKLGFHSSISFQ